MTSMMKCLKSFQISRKTTHPENIIFLLLLFAFDFSYADMDLYTECLPEPGHRTPFIFRAKAAVEAAEDRRERHKVLREMLDQEEQKLFEQEYFTDLWGFPVPWQSPQDGWNQKRRDGLIYNNILNLLQREYIPAFTKTGYLMTRVPKELLKTIKERLTDRQTRESMNEDDALYNNRQKKDGEYNNTGRFKMVEWLDGWDDEGTKVVMKTIRPLLEDWSGIELDENAVVYGPRTYGPNASMQMHVDLFGTHVVSAIMNLDQDTDVPWPLSFIDTTGDKHLLYFKPGDMLMYESARCPHGRQFPLNGTSYTNLFVHYKPKKRWYGGPSTFDPDIALTFDVIGLEDLAS